MAGKTIYLDADLDLAGHEWRSIGIGDNHKLFFGGTFDGQNHYITNLTSKSSADRQGLFGILSDGALVQNLNVLNADIYSANDHLVEGILADWANGSTVRNCYTSGRVESTAGDKMLGGLVGQCTWSSKIIGCGSDAVVVSTYCESEDCDTVGGLIGQWENSSNDSLISDCWFGGSVSCGYIDSAVGGILGANHITFGWNAPTLPADYTEVDALDRSLYTDLSAVDAAVANVVRSCNALQQSDVDAMAQAIRNAVAALVLKGANYTAVDAAIAKADALNKDDYLDFTAVEAAISAVDRSKNITQQAEVDTMAQDIEAALAALQAKPTPAPTQEPTPAPTAAPTAEPTAAPTQAPAQQPAAPAQAAPAPAATQAPTATPTAAPVVTATPAPVVTTAIPATGDSANIALLWVLLVVSVGIVWGVKKKLGD